MGWISLLLQLLSLRKNIVESQSVIAAAQGAAEKGKRFLFCFLGYMLAALFLFSGFLVAVIETGLQIENHGYLSYSGLMVSATILVGIAALFAALSFLAGQREAAVATPPERPRASGGEERVKALLEEFVVNFLAKMVAKTAPPENKPPQD